MKAPRYNRLPTCLHGHLLVADNLIKHGDSLVCRTCNVTATRKWYARFQSRKVLAWTKDQGEVV
jgi:hypothetical protein